MTDPLTVFVPGVPAPQGSARAIVHKHTQRAVLIKANDKRQKSWRGDVRDALTDGYGQPRARFEAAVAVELAFVMPRPKSTPKTRATPAAVKKPDLDKLVRAVFDAITSAGVWTDDSAAVDVRATKRIAEIGEPTGCLITIRDTTAIRPATAPLTLEVPA